MTSKSERKEFCAWASEITRESSDRPVRPYIEQRIRSFFYAIDHKRWEEVKEHLSPDVRMINDLDDPESVTHKRRRVVDHFKDTLSDNFTRTVPRIIIVDRGRVTCQNNVFRAFPDNPTAPQDEAEFDQFTAKDHVVIIDLDDNYFIKRIETRFTDWDAVTFYGGLEALNAEVTNA